MAKQNIDEVDTYIDDNSMIELDEDFGFDPVEDSYDRDVEAFQQYAEREFD